MPNLQTRLVELRTDLVNSHGSSWSITDERALANSIAQIALGQWRHLESILSAARIVQPLFPIFASSARDLLVVPPGTESWHRDGWLFQCISWIAAAETSAGPLRPPHSIWANKGFDGLQLELGRRGRKVKRLLIFEDKATSNPRATVRNEVWPEFVKMENGDRKHELVSELNELLSRAPNVNVQEAADRIFLRGGLAYRIAITISDAHNSDAGLVRLFKGYEKTVRGSKSRRSGHVLYLNDLRPWMESIAQLAIEEIDRIENV